LDKLLKIGEKVSAIGERVEVGATKDRLDEIKSEITTVNDKSLEQMNLTSS
jgi:hypothetical protein